MKTRLLLILIAALVSSSFISPADSKFEIDIIQNGEVLDMEENVVKLKKAPFAIRVKLFDLEGVYMNASHNKELFELEGDKPIPEILFIESKTMAEAAFNSDRTLTLSKGLYSYLFYDPELNWHRFDSSVVLAGQCTGFKTVENIYDQDTDKTEETKKTKKDIYLFFVSVKKGQNGQTQELARHKIALRWK